LKSSNKHINKFPDYKIDFKGLSLEGI